MLTEAQADKHSEQEQRVVMKRNLGYMRCCPNVQNPENGLTTTNLQATEWANFAKNAKNRHHRRCHGSNSLRRGRHIQQ